MPINSVNGVKSGRLRSYLRNFLFALLGVGSAAGVTGGYLHLNNKIQSGNTEITQKLSESEAARAGLATELGKANATISRLEQNMAVESARLKENTNTLSGHEEQITTLGKRNKEHEETVTGLNKDLNSVKIKVGALEREVSISELQDIYNKALSSVVVLNMGVKYKEDDDMGKKVEKIEFHQGSGVVAAHINSGKEGGYIITNWHILKCEHLKSDDDYKNIELTITLPNNTTVKAKPYFYKDDSGKEKLARKVEHDLILLKTTDNISSTTAVAFATEEPKAGEAVIVIGSPFGPALGNRFYGSFGIISGESMVKYEGGNTTLSGEVKKGSIKTATTDATMNPGSSGGLGWSVKDEKMVFMPSFIYPGEIFHGMGFGVTAPTIVSDLKTWIPYDQTSDGTFVERKVEPIKQGLVKLKQ